MIRWLSLIMLLSLSLSVSSTSYANQTYMPWHTDKEYVRDASESFKRDKEIRCLALNIFHESRNQGTQGWLAVAFVTINRVFDPRFPKSICEVVWEPKQFSWTHDGLSDKPDLSKYPDRKAWEYILEFSRGFLENHKYIEDPTNGSLYYHKNTIEPSWRDNFEVAVEIGEHIFYINQGRYR